MLSYLHIRVLLEEEQIADVCSWGKVEDIEDFHVLWIILEQKDHVILLKVVQVQIEDGIFHMHLESLQLQLL